MKLNNTIFVCKGKKCKKAGAKLLLKKLKKLVVILIFNLSRLVLLFGFLLVLSDDLCLNVTGHGLVVTEIDAVGALATGEGLQA